MPDLRGLSAREALRKLTRLGLTASMSGNGVVLDQQPAAGSVLAPGQHVCAQARSAHVRAGR